MTTDSTMTTDELRSRLRRLADTGTPTTIPALPDPETHMATVRPLPAPAALSRRLFPVLAAAAAIVVVVVALTVVPRGDDSIDTAGLSGSWAPLAPAPIAGRVSPASIVLDGELFVFGGQAVDGPWLADAAAYDPTTDTWRRLADAPVPVSPGSAAVADGTGILVVPTFPGTLVEGEPGEVTYEVLRYEPATDRWTVPTLPVGVAAAASAQLDGVATVFTIGETQGSDTAQSISLSVLGPQAADGSARSSTEIAAVSMPAAPHRYAGLSAGRFVALVGVDGRLFDPLTLGFRHDVTSDQVETIDAAGLVALAEVDEPALVELLPALATDGTLTVVGAIIDTSGATTRIAARLPAGSDEWERLSTPDRLAVGDVFPGMTLTDTGGTPVLVGGYELDGMRVGGLDGTGGALEVLDGTRWRALPPPALDLQRVGHVAVWTGRELIVWGGATDAGGSQNRADVAFDDGARFVVGA